METFTCNICGSTCRDAQCASCGATARDRDILQVLSMELFGTLLALPEIPRCRSIRGLGISDSHVYADRLAAKFDYRNTFYDREPKLDIVHPPAEEIGKYDFVISSEVFEHVLPPVEATFENTSRLLKPNGVLILTTPYSLAASTAEHFPQLHEYGFAQVGDRLVLVNRTREGVVQTFENPVFHQGCSGDALEVREFSESSLRGLLTQAGFKSLQMYTGNCPACGIVRTQQWSLPIAARKGEFSLNSGATREVMEHWRTLTHRVALMNRSYWFRIGCKLKFF